MATQKQLKVVQLLSENVGISVGEAMRLAGYSESTSKSPQRLTNCRGWKDAVEDLIPDMDLLETHRELLSAESVDTMYFPKGMSDSEIEMVITSCKGQKLISIINTSKKRKVLFTRPDNPVKVSALNMAFRLRGLFSTKKCQHCSSEKSEYSDLTMSELEEAIANVRKQLNMPPPLYAQDAVDNT